MIENLEILNTSQKLPFEVNIGIGIATGNVISGNIGSKTRFEHTVIGNPVNLASRLESLTKFYKLKTLICESTYQKISSAFICREIDTIKVKGRQKSVTIFTIVKKNKDKLLKKERLFLKSYAQGLNAYRNKKFNQAIKDFGMALSFYPEDKPSQILLSRASNFIVTPPKKNWSGTWKFTNK